MLLLAFVCFAHGCQRGWTTLLEDDFEDGIADGWYFADSTCQPLATPWPVVKDGGKFVFSGSDHTWAMIEGGHEWSDYSMEVSLKLISGGVNLNCRLGNTGRYFISFSNSGLFLYRQIWPDTFFNLGKDQTTYAFGTWYHVKVVCRQDNLKVYVDGKLRLEYTDPDYLPQGSIAFETLDESRVFFDNLTIVGKPSAPPCSHPVLPSSWVPLFESSFEEGSAGGWSLGVGWHVEKNSSGNYVLTGTGHHWANPNVVGWNDCAIQAKIKLISGGFHFNFRISDGRASDTQRSRVRYFLSVHEQGLSLLKQVGSKFFDLNRCRIHLTRDDWHLLKIHLSGTAIKIYVDDALRLDWVDENEPIMFGKFAFETLNGAHIQFDEVVVFGEPPPDPPPGYVWTKTGGPSGGLGYDVRIHPLDKRIMFVTDNPSGVNKSCDAGITWTQRNQGITTRTGPSGDGVPIFSLTIDPANPDIVWAGTQDAKGIYKSTNGGEKWTKKDDGVTEGNEISFRGFGVHPDNSNIVFAGAEISSGILGHEFEKTRGKIYKTVNGGENWSCAWEGNNLVRFILFDPSNPKVMYASTGIFDREAYNDEGVGILKSIDGGQTWSQINNGIPNSKGNRFAGFFEMHPVHHQVLFAASGNNVHGPGGVFRTKNGGLNWEKKLSDDIFTIVTISSSDPNVVYAGSSRAFYRSEDGGDTWRRLWKQAEDCWGPPGVRAGFPISAVVDPEDPYTLFANNYGGGNFKSTDGAETWVDASKGYTGAHLHAIAMDADDPAVIYALGRSGPFRSPNGGDDWIGLAFSPANSKEWNAIALNPHNSEEILIADEFEGVLLKSVNKGSSWREVFRHPDAGRGGAKQSRHGFKALAYAPANPKIIYAGMRKGRSTINGIFPAQPSFGMYKSIDGARTWVPINNGLGSSLININCIAVHPVNSKIVYIGTWKDGVYKTTDGGLNWMYMSNGLASADIRSLCIDPQNPQVVYAGLGEGAGIFKTINGGELWEETNKGIILKCPSALLPIGKVRLGISMEPPPRRSLRTDYYTVPWTSIWSIVIDPTDSQRLYAADHQSGIYLSADGGANWVPINEGLTNKAVTALEISNDGRILYAATEGAGVFRLGPIEVDATPSAGY
jgi:photosystem II stability/assembly factor-like uncharacterized protein